MKKNFPLWLLSGMSGLALSFSASASRPMTDHDVAQSGNGFSAYMLADEDILWAWTGSTVNVPVCWRESVGQFLAQKENVRRAVTNTWQANSMIRFTGWGDCSPADQYTGKPAEIRIGLTSGNPSSYVGMSAMSRWERGMLLNLAPNCIGEGAADTCSAFDAIHEFGHAMGLVHEQNRPDTPDSCYSKSPPYIGYNNIYFGDWDLRSVMNYCNPRDDKNSMLPSLSDLAAIKYAYDHIATFDFTQQEVVLPVVTYKGENYRAVLELAPDKSIRKWRSAVKTQDLSSSPSIFDGSTLTVPISIYPETATKWMPLGETVFSNIPDPDKVWPSSPVDPYADYPRADLKNEIITIPVVLYKGERYSATLKGNPWGASVWTSVQKTTNPSSVTAFFSADTISLSSSKMLYSYDGINWTKGDASMYTITADPLGFWPARPIEDTSTYPRADLKNEIITLPVVIYKGEKYSATLKGLPYGDAVWTSVQKTTNTSPKPAIFSNGMLQSSRLVYSEDGINWSDGQGIILTMPTDPSGLWVPFQ